MDEYEKKKHKPKSKNTSKDHKKDIESSMNDPSMSLDEKMEVLRERAKEISTFLKTLATLKGKLQKKKVTIKEIIEKKIEDNEKELKKWKELMFIIVDESLDEKIEKLDTQEVFFKTTRKEIEKVLETSKNGAAEDESDSESEDPKLDDFLELDLKLEPEGLTTTETTEMEYSVKKDFNVLLNEPKKSLRRTFAYVGGIIRGYLRRGKSNINWIKIMRKLEGREFEERMVTESADPYIGSKIALEEDFAPLDENITNTWNSITSLFENRNHTELRSEFCNQLYTLYDRKPEDVMFYLPQLCNLLLNQYNQFQPLKQFFLDKCKGSVHFALQAYLLVRASKDSREPPKKKKVIPDSIIRWRTLCNSLLAEIRKAVSLPPLLEYNVPSKPVVTENITLNPLELTPESTDHIFQYPIKFMDQLVEVSGHLVSVPPDQYLPELEKSLEKLDQEVEKDSTSFVYIPLLKPAGSADYHRVVRIPHKEAYPIPTYQRVLFYVLVEVVDVVHKEEDRSDRKKKHKSDKKKKKEDRDKEPKDDKKDEKKDSKEGSEVEVITEPGNIVQDAILKMEDEDIDKRLQSPDSEEKKKKKHRHKEKKLHPLNLEADLSAIASRTSSTESLTPTSGSTSSVNSQNSSMTNLPSMILATSPGNPLVVPPTLQPSVNNGPNAPPAASDAQKGLVRSMISTQPLGYHSAFGELWERKAKRIQKESPYGNLPGWRLQSLIVKYGEEVLQEEFAMQLIILFQRIFMEANVPVKLCPYRILALSNKSGLIEPIPNSLSLDKLKKQHTNLLNFFTQAFGDTSEPSFKQAQQNFIKTMAAYSVVCYLLQIKDRHNGNILLDASGHIIHIDFGYLLGKTIKFEQAPFKLTNEFVEVMGGYNSPCYKQYCRLCVKSYLQARKHYKKIMHLVEMTMEGKGKKVLSCLSGDKVLPDLLARFHLEWTDEECENFIMELIEEARGSWRTIVYDAYQLILNNIH